MPAHITRLRWLDANLASGTGSPRMASVYELFQRALRVEEVSALMYAALAKRFDDEETSALFARLEAEEWQHASRVELLFAHYRHDPKLLAGMETDIGPLEACIAESEQALAEIQAGQWEHDLAVVKQRLAALEQRLAAAHADLLLRNAHPGLRAFFAQLAEQDEAHARLLTP